MRALADRLSAVDGRLMAAPTLVRASVIAVTLLTMFIVSLPHVPRSFLDYSRRPWLSGITQPETYGTDTLADTYVARVVVNDVRDMYTKRKVAQTPLEAQTWSKEASAPYPPAVLLAEAGLYAIGEKLGVGLYGMGLALAVLFLGASLVYCWQTRWYLFPLLYLNFSYFSERFVFVQDVTYLVMLCVVMAALFLARARHSGTHALMALAIVMKVSPLFYLVEVSRMRRRDRMIVALILAAGLLLPIALFENYLYIFTFHDELKGRWYSSIAAGAIAVPFAIALWRAEARNGFDAEDRVGWGLVPFALFLGFKMNVARHLLIVLLVPDKRGLRTLVVAIALLVPAALPDLVRFNSALPIAAVLLAGVLTYYLTHPAAARQR